MRQVSYDQSDEIHDRLQAVGRAELERFVPYGGAAVTEAAFEFWMEVMMALNIGDWQCAVELIETRFQRRAA